MFSSFCSGFFILRCHLCLQVLEVNHIENFYFSSVFRIFKFRIAHLGLLKNVEKTFLFSLKNKKNSRGQLNVFLLIKEQRAFLFVFSFQMKKWKREKERFKNSWMSIFSTTSFFLSFFPSFTFYRFYDPLGLAKNGKKMHQIDKRTFCKSAWPSSIKIYKKSEFSMHL